MKLFKFLRLIRVHQWIKNIFVFVPLLFSLHLFNKEYFFTTLLAFFVFCLASSAIYVINDLVDIESDRAHPLKRNRPLPSGTISKTTAIITAAFLIMIVFWSMMYFNREFILLVVIFVLLNISYSFWLKNLVLLDIFFYCSRIFNQGSCWSICHFGSDFQLAIADHDVYISIPRYYEAKVRISFSDREFNA